jgi:hypothetical protein
MYVELFAGGGNNFPRFTRTGGGGSKVDDDAGSTCRASRGQFYLRRSRDPVVHGERATSM